MGGVCSHFCATNQSQRTGAVVWAARRELRKEDPVPEKASEETVILRPQPSGAPVDEFRIVQEDDAYVVEGKACA